MPQSAGTQILLVLQDRIPRTIRQIARDTRLPLGNCGPTVTKLAAAGKVRLAGTDRNNRSKRPANVWVIA